MGLYRPPLPKGSPFITPAGYRRLHQELDALWKRRVEVTQARAAAAAEGERSVNAELFNRKKELREIDRRIRYLQKRLPELTVVIDAPSDKNRVFFGARVRLEDAHGEERNYRIVCPDELDLAKKDIRVDSPLARALLK